MSFQAFTGMFRQPTRNVFDRRSTGCHWVWRGRVACAARGFAVGGL